MIRNSHTGFWIWSACLLLVNGTAPPITPLATFNSTYNQVCGGGAANSTACKALLFNETRAHFRNTDYLNKENGAVEDVLKALENDWGFAVNQFATIGPQVDNFVSSNSTTMSALVNNLSSRTDGLVSQVNPVLAWAFKGLQNLLNADSVDGVNFTNASDAAVQRLLNQAMTVGQIFPHQVNMYAKNTSAYADAFFNKEFFRVKNGTDGKYQALRDSLSRVQGKLQNQRNYVTNQINFLNVTASQLDDTMNVYIPKRFADQRAALITTLRDRIAQRLGGQAMQRQTAMINTKLATYGAQQAQSLNATFSADMDSTLDQIEARMNQTIVAAAAQAQQFLDQFGASNNAGAVNWDEIAGLLDALTSANGAAAAAYMISDSDLGNDSIANFRSIRDDISGSVQGTGGTVGMLLNRVRTDLDAYAFGVRTQLANALDAMSTTDNNKTVAALQGWAAYTSDLYNNQFSVLQKTFQSGLKNITDAVMLRINGVTLGEGESLADASTKSILGSNLQMFNQTELSQQATSMNDAQNALLRDSNNRLFQIVKTINETGRDSDLALADQAASASVRSVKKYFDSSLIGNKSNADALLVNVRLQQIDIPINAAIDKFNAVKGRVQALVNRNAAMTQTLTNYANTLMGASGDANRMYLQIKTQLDSRARAVQDIFTVTGDEMSAAMADYVSKYTSGLPDSTGFARMASDRIQNVTNVQDYISKSGISIQQLVDDQQTVIRNYQDRLNRASKNFAMAQAEIARRDSVKSPDFVGMNNIRNLTQRFDKDAESKKQGYTITNEYNRIAQDFRDRDLLVTKALGTATKESSARGSELGDLQAKLNSRNVSFQSLQNTYNSKVGNSISSVASSLNGSSQQIGILQNSNRGQMSAQTLILLQSIKDLLYQISTSAPAYLAQYETDKIADLTSRLQAINTTLPSVVPSSAASISFIHQAKANKPQASPNLVQIMDIIHDKSEIDALKTSIGMAVKSAQAAIASHKPIDLEVPENVGLESSEFANATDNVLVRLQLLIPRLVRNVNNLHDQTSLRLDQLFTNNQTDISNAVKVVETMIRNMTRVEEWVLRQSLSVLNRNMEQFNTSVGIWNEFAGNIENSSKKLESLIDGNERLNTSQPQEQKQVLVYPKLEKMKEWLKSFIAETQSTVDAKLKASQEGFNKTLTAIGDLHAKLTKMEADEEKVETDFQTHVLAKLIARNQKANAKTDADFAKLEKDLDKFTRSLRHSTVAI